MGEIRLPKRLSGLSKLMTGGEQAASTFARLHCTCISFPISACLPPFLGMFLFKRRERTVNQQHNLEGPEQLLLPSPLEYKSTPGMALLSDAHYLFQAAGKKRVRSRSPIHSQILSKLQRTLLEAVAHRSSNPTPEFILKTDTMNPNGHTHEIFINTEIHPQKEPLVDWSSVAVATFSKKNKIKQNPYM